ncbi:DsbA family protein [Pelagibius marinus]|uniref:DsbA family protein n=1 Tax=Pelagibius marinus TaxID=2762760 RepID=UPI001872ADE9|nr:thioredoxin domain-containing protein [Pelagibius marinus]
MNRRNILIGLGVVAAGAAAGGAYWLRAPQTPLPGSAASQEGVMTLAANDGGEPLFDDDRILGSAEAPVTILEYSSLTCPHCANFHKNTLPQVKSEWIDAGRARLVYRHYPLDQLALRAAAAADCIEGDAFFGFLDVLFKNQERWAHSDDPLKALQQLAALAGISPDAFEACTNDEAQITRILEKQTDGRDRYSIASTPSFVVNGTLVQGAMPYDEFNAALEQASAKAS